MPYSRLVELISGIESVMFTTVNADGSVNSRPMIVHELDQDGDIWFFTPRVCSKVGAISADSHVCIAFMDSRSNRYISVSGYAELVTDPWVLGRVWSGVVERWLPTGSSAEDLALIRVRVIHAEYWDTPQGETMATFDIADPVEVRRSPCAETRTPCA